MNRQIRVRKNSTFLIFEGPSTLGIEHSQFDEQQGSGPRKSVHFGIQTLGEAAKVDYIFRSISIGGDPSIPSSLDVAVIGTIRADPRKPICQDWILWCMDGGIKIIIHYSTATRLGCGKFVEEFPKF